VHHLRDVAVPELLRRISASEPSRAAPETEALIARSLPRVRNVVAAFRLPEHPDVRIESHDRDDVVQDALRRALAMLESFRGTTEGEWFAAVITCARFTCRDHLRARMTAEKRLAGRLEDAPETQRFDSDLARIAERVQIDHEAAREASDWLENALKTLPNPNQRRAVELTRDGHSTEEIAKQLKTSVDNVHQLRSRAFAQLRKDRP
jgi:RNA polymerase sigma factor (sigma-70 family)